MTSHFGPNGPDKCGADKGRCPYGGPSGRENHFATQEEAEKAYFEQHKDSVFATMKKPVQKMKPASYNPHNPEMDAALVAAPVYAKTTKVGMRVAKAGETLETRLADGTLETSRVLEGGEYIVRNPGGEEYAMGREKFLSRYMDLGNGEWKAKGEVKAVRNPTGGPIEIDAPWGEKQIGGPDCWIAAAPDDPNDRYIIGAEEFADTYVQI